MKKQKAYCPAAISCIFRVWKNENQKAIGSTGVGFTVNKGVVVTVSESDTTVLLFNDKEIFFPTVQTVLNSLTTQPLRVEIETEFPLGYGFGISGASALATAYAVNQLLHLGKTNLELALAAHDAEIENGTGLGTVATQCNGGFLLKIKPGIPGEYKRFSFEGTSIYSYPFKSLETKSIVTNEEIVQHVNKNADRALSQIQRLPRPNLSDILQIAERFVTESNLVQNTNVRMIIDEIKEKGGYASMHILGHVVVSDMKLKNTNPIQLQIANETAHLI